MLVAQTKTKQWITAADAQKTNQFFCPGCGGPLVLKKGRVLSPHFAHGKKQACDSLSEGETSEHLALKQKLLAWGQASTPDWQLEEPLPALNQRPDLLWENLAVEIQCSPLAQARLAQRRENYRQHDYHDWWLLGKKLWPNKRLTTLQKYFCDYTPHWGLHLWLIDEKRQQVRLWSHLQESAVGLRYEVAVFPFFRRTLAELFYERPPIKRTPLVLSSGLSNLQKEKLARGLLQKKTSLGKIQHFFYERHTHLLHLASWYYLPSSYQLFFGEQVIVLRYLFATEGLNACQNYISAEPWFFPNIERKKILAKFAQETAYLMKKMKNF